MAVLVGGGVLAASYIFRVLSLAFTGADVSDEEFKFRRPARVMEASALGMAILAVALGIFSQGPVALVTMEGGNLP